MARATFATGKIPARRKALPCNVEVIEAVGGSWLVLVDGFQWGPTGSPDRSGAYSATWNTHREAVAAFQTYRARFGHSSRPGPL